MKPEETYYEDQVSEAKARRKALPEDLRTMTPRTQAMHDTFAPEFTPEYCYQVMLDHAKQIELELYTANGRIIELTTKTPPHECPQESVTLLAANHPNLAEYIAQMERQIADGAKMLGMATDLNLDLQNKADMWRDEFQRIRAIVYDSDLHTNSEIAGICDRAITDIRSKISLIDQREKAADMIAKLNDEATATEALLRMYGWKEDESLQMFLHRTRQPADALRHSPEYMTKLLQDCEGELAKATAALKAIFDCTDPYADGVIDASAHDKLCNEISSLARPWARTHSENKVLCESHED